MGYQDTVVHQGRQMTYGTLQKFLQAQAYARLEHGDDVRLNLVQGSWSTKVSASGGTHAKAGAGDCGSFRRLPLAEVARILRLFDLCAWARPALAGQWGDHVHFIDPDAAPLSEAAARQVVSYRRRRNGLASDAPDPMPQPTAAARAAARERLRGPGRGTGWLPGIDPGTVAAAIAEWQRDPDGLAVERQSVRNLQGALNAWLVNPAVARLELDGRLGRQTYARLRQFQESVGDRPDGSPVEEVLRDLVRVPAVGERFRLVA